jgi:YD repeat-containing protein
MNTRLRELAHREQDGLQVTLLWDARSNTVSIEVLDERDESRFLLPVAGHSALDAFHHPYAYAVAAVGASAASARVTS